MAAEASPQLTHSEEAIIAKAYDGLSGYVQKMTEKAYRLASDALTENPTVDQLVDLAAAVEQAIDNQVFRFAGKLEVLHQQGVSPTIACSKGCAYCCGTQIMATVPEVLRLAKWINENFSTEEIQALRQRLAAFNAKVRAIKESGGPRPPIDCAILMDDSCSAHPGRPIACRGANSVNVGACIKARENWQDESLNIPLVGQPYYASKSMVRGVRDAMKDRGLPSPIIEMPFGLEVVLNDPMAGEKFLAGEPVFDGGLIEA